MNVDTGTWTWRVVDAAGAHVAADAPAAQSRFDAETWLGEHWRGLAAAGAVRAVLMCDGTLVGPPVELRGYEY